MAIYDRALRSLIERIGIVPTQVLCKQAGVQAVHRLIVYYPDGHAAHSVATLIQHRSEQTHKIEIYYDGLFNHKAIYHEVDNTTYEAYITLLQKAGFDNLVDMLDRDLSGYTLWCIERASGGHHHAIVLTPAVAQKPYTLIINAVENYLSEAIRAVPR